MSVSTIAPAAAASAAATQDQAPPSGKKHRRRKGRKTLGSRRIERTKSFRAKDGPTAGSHARMRLEILHDFCMAIFNMAPGSQEVTISFSGSTHQGLKSKKPHEAAHRFPLGTVRTNVREIYVDWLVAGDRKPRMVKRLADYGIDVAMIGPSPTKSEVIAIFDEAHFHDITCVKTREFGVASQGTDDMHGTINQADSQMERFFRGEEVQEICINLMNGSVSRVEGETLLKEKLVEHFTLAKPHLESVQEALSAVKEAAEALSMFSPTKPVFPAASPGSLKRHITTITASGMRGLGAAARVDDTVPSCLAELGVLRDSGASNTPQREAVKSRAKRLRKTAKECGRRVSKHVEPRMRIYKEQHAATEAYVVPPPFSTPDRSAREKDLSMLRLTLERVRSAASSQDSSLLSTQEEEEYRSPTPDPSFIGGPAPSTPVTASQLKSLGLSPIVHVAE